MSRPRRAASQPAALAPNIQRGLASIVDGNERLIEAMLGAEATGRQNETLAEKLAQVMSSNHLSHEMMLARFFDAKVLGEYCRTVLNKSDKGAAATLAARIAKEWDRKDFDCGGGSTSAAAADEPVAAQASSWRAPTWLELQTDSDDDEEEAQRKKRLKAEMRQAKKAKVAAPAAASEPAPEQRPEATSAPKQLKLDAAETASALSRAAFHDGGEEASVVFDAAHYGPGGLNGRFEAVGAVELFAGSEAGGGGMFESGEARELARRDVRDALLNVFRAHGLTAGATALDCGAGTGLLLPALTEAVGGSGRVLAVDLSATFVSHLRRRFGHLAPTLQVSRSSAKALSLPATCEGTVDIAIVVDVYHHFEYPMTMMASIRSALKPTGRVVVLDFHRDPSKMTHHAPSWALEHIRADQHTFRSEIEAAGFTLLAEPALPELTENYIMCFGKGQAPRGPAESAGA